MARAGVGREEDTRGGGADELEPAEVDDDHLGARLGAAQRPVGVRRGGDVKLAVERHPE